jgi:hypothetical protein
MRTNPPTWAEAALRLFLRSEIFLTVSGDLLEQYRDSILPSRGLMRADCWYLTQVLGFVVRGMLPWAALFAAAFVARFAMDALDPTADFHVRSAVTTYIVTALLIAVGFRAAWRSGSLLAGMAAGLAMAAGASLMSLGGVAVVLAFRHDADAMTAIAASGGLREALVMPFIAILPAILMSGLSGMAGAGVRRSLNFARRRDF